MHRLARFLALALLAAPAFAGPPGNTVIEGQKVLTLVVREGCGIGSGRFNSSTGNVARPCTGNFGTWALLPT